MSHNRLLVFQRDVDVQPSDGARVTARHGRAAQPQGPVVRPVEPAGGRRVPAADGDDLPATGRLGEREARLHGA